MGRRIQFEVDGIQAFGEVHDDVSPKTAEAFWQSLPIETALIPAKWSGQACYFHPSGATGAMKEVTELENPVTSIYPGTVVARPRGSEALIAYGPSEYRWGIGTDYVTRVARVTENRAALLKVIGATHDEGEKVIKITRAESA